ncbi:MAG: hypothetical protein RID15_07350 [Marinovum algicola]|uniref:Uncharacterized protein n=1 Tax=Marinovum algicola TaxID=42444 RepID=A0A975W670_9RHOB|nr:MULTISPECIES: hypothetical protein [Marinovum]MDD9741187.1 hypothetical protein [Marinovum sp. SP66]MDD9743632.1 hypothetical protein [Marinovum sp. PR37]SEI55196.1 hypothetical protein SAMN04487940_101199 [Marinovum algicola]SLN28875.1 hypothetical protein MAA5396_01258 [Marinovum algicola]
MSKTWHIRRDACGLTLSRRPEARFDVAARAEFPPLRMLPLAHMIRQDMWRRLRRLRGFAPAVQVTRTGAGLTVTAGGSVTAAFPKARTEAQIGDLLHDPELRARWQRCALLTGGKVLI